MGAEPSSPFLWGTTVRRRATGIPFLCYEPRRRHMADLLEDAERWSARTHLVHGDRRLSFGDVRTAVELVGERLVERGVRPGDRVLLLAGNSPEWVISLWAGTSIGAVVALGNAWWSAAEVEHAVGLVTPAVVVCDDRRRGLLPAGDSARAVDVDTIAAWSVDAATRPTRERPGRVVEDDPALIVFTAGTTGAPKAVTLAHRSVISNLHDLLAGANRLPQQIDPERPNAVVLQSGPLFHIGGVQSLLLAAVAGNTLVFLNGRFDPGEVLDLIERERVTVWGGVPTMASRVLDHPSLPHRELTSVRSITMGGSRVPAELLERMRLAFPNARKGMSTIYGMTEAGGTVASASGTLMAQQPETSGPPGRVVDMRIAEADETGTGEILVRTPAQMIGYWDPELTAPTGAGSEAGPIDVAGWLSTGDLGRIDDGLLYVIGRSKDIVIRGGENIAAAHVEAVLTRHPDVLTAAVVGLPDADLGERVAAALQLRPQALVTAEQLTQFAAQSLARFEVPVEWHLQTAALPTTDVGKIDKRALRDGWDELVGSERD